MAPNGRSVVYQYDDFGRVFKETRPGKNNVIDYGHLAITDCPSLTSLDSKAVFCIKSQASERGSSFVQYDYAGRELRSMTQSFDGSNVLTDTQWDNSGRKTSVTRPYFLGELAYHVQFEYDLFNREISKREPNANGTQTVWKTSYDGFSTTVTDGKGFKHRTTTNVMGHILKKEEALNSLDYTYQNYRYFPDGKLKVLLIRTVIRPRSNTITWVTEAV